MRVRKKEIDTMIVSYQIHQMVTANNDIVTIVSDSFIEIEWAQTFTGCAVLVVRIIKRLSD